MWAIIEVVSGKYGDTEVMGWGGGGAGVEVNMSSTGEDGSTGCHHK